MVRAFAGVLLLAVPHAAEKSQVLIARHCLRMSANEAKNVNDEFKLLSDYTAYPLPDWGVPEDWCTVGGMQVSEALGADLQANFGVDPAKMSMTADISMRDGDTATAMLMGMKAACAVEFDPILYSTTDPEAGDPVCPEPDEALVAQEIKARMAEVPEPWPLQEAIAEFEEVFGVGAAGSLRGLNHTFDEETGTIGGPINAMKELSQNLLYSRASGIDYLTDRATKEHTTRFYAWQQWYRSVKDMQSEKAVESTFLLARALGDLMKPGHSTIHYGHDGNLDSFALYFDLEWEAPPFLGGKLLPTPPNSAIRFVHDDVAATVSASMLYVPDYDQPAYAESPIRTWRAAEFFTLAKTNLKRHIGAEECFSKAPKSQELNDLLFKAATSGVLV